MTYKILRTLFFSVVPVLFIQVKAFAQTDSSTLAETDLAALAKADTSRFSVNNAGGWELYNSYLAAYDTDSIQFEAIVRHDNNINWSDEQYIGEITSEDMRPYQEQSLSFALLADTYSLRVDTEGKCYLRFVAGNLPEDTHVVIPVKVFYKR